MTDYMPDMLTRHYMDSIRALSASWNAPIYSMHSGTAGSRCTVPPLVSKTKEESMEVKKEKAPSLNIDDLLQGDLLNFNACLKWLSIRSKSRTGDSLAFLNYSKFPACCGIGIASELNYTGLGATEINRPFFDFDPPLSREEICKLRVKDLTAAAAMHARKDGHTVIYVVISDYQSVYYGHTNTEFFSNMKHFRWDMIHEFSNNNTGRVLRVMALNLNARDRGVPIYFDGEVESREPNEEDEFDE